MDWWLIIGIFLLGGATGAALYHLVAKSGLGKGPIESRLVELQDEFVAYRENVQQHFSKTTELINNLTESYNAVQTHLVDSQSYLSQPPKSFSIDEEDLQKLETHEELPDEPVAAIEDLNKLRAQAEIDDASFEDQPDISAPKDYAEANGK